MQPLRVLNAAQMRAADRRTIDELGVPSAVLMETAGRQVVDAMEAALAGLATARVAVLCGTGNNGGDGFVIGRVLQQRGIDSTVYLVGDPEAVQGDARLNLDILRRLEARVVKVADGAAWESHTAEATSADVVVDALMGTGLTRALSGLLAAVVGDVNGSSARVVAVDVPSGLLADSAELHGPAVQAHLTVTLAAPKVPLVLPPAERLAGDVVVADIGIPASFIAAVDGPRLYLLTEGAVRVLVPPRAADAHKGDFGRVVIVAGSRGMTGAAALAARGALRSGAGLVTVATPASVQPVVAGLGVEFMTLALDDEDGRVTAQAADQVLALDADVLAIGPGLGGGSAVAACVRALLERARVPLVVDADALNACAGALDLLRGRPDRPVVITPHPGEFGRLVGRLAADVQAHRAEAAVTFAAEHGVHVVLKGHRTVIATPGGSAFLNPTGTSGMATGGSGDVLTGVIAAWLAQGLAPAEACQLGVFVHGAAGERAAAAEGEAGMVAGDLAGHLGPALRGLMEGASAPQDE